MKVLRSRGLAITAFVGCALCTVGAARAQDAPPPAPEPQQQEAAPVMPAAPAQAALPAPAAENGNGALAMRGAITAPQNAANNFFGGPNFDRRDERKDDRDRLEVRLRALMANMGIQEPGTQDALIVYLAEDEKGKNDVREAARRLMVGLKREATPERMKDLISAYKNSLENDKIRRRAAQASLDAKIGYSTNPKLEAMLWVVGVLGDGFMPLPMGQNMGRPYGSRPPQQGNALTARAAPPGTAMAGALAADTVANQNQVCIGVVETKTDTYVEVRDDTGKLERYMPRVVNGAAAVDLDAATLDQMRQIIVGQRVRLEWVMADGKRLISIKPAVTMALQAAPVAKEDTPTP